MAVGDIAKGVMHMIQRLAKMSVISVFVALVLILTISSWFHFDNTYHAEYAEAERLNRAGKMMYDTQCQTAVSVESLRYMDCVTAYTHMQLDPKKVAYDKAMVELWTHIPIPNLSFCAAGGVCHHVLWKVFDYVISNGVWIGGVFITGILLVGFVYLKIVEARNNQSYTLTKQL